MSTNVTGLPAPHVIESSAPAEARGLSRRQTLVWLDAQLFPNARYHNLVLTVDLTGPLDYQRFAAAWAATVANVDALRTVIDAREPLQTRAATFTALPVIDLESSAVASWVAERCALALGPERRWDAALLRIGPEHHVVYLNQDHIISDGLSMLLLAEDLGERYAGRVPRPAASFDDYLRFEAQYQASAKAERDRAYWTEHLARAPGPLRLYGKARTDRSVALQRSWDDAGHDRARALTELAEHEPFKTMSGPLSRMTVMATGLAAFLYRAGGEREVLLGIPFGNRTARFARTYGLLMEQIFLRVEIDEGETYRTLGAKVRRELLAGVRHGQTCTSDRGLHYATLNLLPPPPERFGDLTARCQIGPAATWAGVRDAGSGDLRDTFGVQIFDFADGPLRVGLDFHAATFDERSRKRARAHFYRVLDAMGADVGATLDTVDLLDSEERALVLATARGPEPAGDPPDVIAQFRIQAARRPQHPAVEGPDGRLTYAELDRVTDALAKNLRAMGVRSESRVAIALPRGVRELSALLATLKAGGCYVPVDPTHPLDRVRMILEDAAPEVLLAPSDSPLSTALPAGTRHLTLDVLDAEICVSTDTAAAFAPDQLAYILFTSGSTGRPKGVEISRSAFANFLRSMAHSPGLADSDRLLAITTTTFDIAGLELFLPLWAGATVVIADRDTAADPKRLRECLEKQTISVMQATPATWRLLLDAGWRSTLHLRMLCGGEAMSPQLAQRLLAGGGELWNMYGPTETTVWSTLARIQPGDADVVIGRPIDHTSAYVLDGGLKVVPRGIVGELYLGGHGLARGYRGRPDLTAERFLPDPYGPPGSCIYRTGDLARLLEDGRFECLGRVDHQVKIRGFRIELGEIESVLRGLPGVQEALVVADPNRDGDLVLCVYWVGNARPDDLHSEARAKLPAYMVPSAYVPLVAFPLNTNGKVDRKALPKPEAGHLATVPLKIWPRTRAEERMAAIWSGVLEVSPIAVNQDFFDLGGTSVKVIEARARIEQVFGVELPLPAFFETPTIEQLVGRLGTALDSSEPLVMPLRRGGAHAATLHCLLGIELYKDLATSLEYDHSVYGIHVPIGAVPVRASAPSVEIVANGYVAAIRAWQPHGPYHLAGFCFGGVVAYETALQLEAAGESVATVAIFDGYLPSAKSFDLHHLVGNVVRRAIESPGELARGLQTRLRGALAARKFRRAKPTLLRGRSTEFQVDGPEIEAEVSRYEKRRTSLHAHLMVFRATHRKWPMWVRMRKDLGWGGRAGRMTLHDIPSDHLDMVRRPHAGIVAAILAAAMNADFSERGGNTSPTSRREVATVVDAPSTKPASTARKSTSVTPNR